MNVRRSLVAALASALLSPLASASEAQARTGPSAAQTASQSDLLDRAAAVWAKVRTARASFQQTITNPLTGRTLTATGEYQQQRPGRLSVRFADPANDRIVADGKHLWLYLPSSAPGQVMRMAAPANGSGTVDLTAQFLTAPRARFTITPGGTLDLGGRSTRAFTLVPKEKEGAPFQTATVWIDPSDATIRQFAVTEPSGVQRQVRLTSLRTNVPVDASAFRFDVPQGVRIIDR